MLIFSGRLAITFTSPLKDMHAQWILQQRFELLRVTRLECELHRRISFWIWTMRIHNVQAINTLHTRTSSGWQVYHHMWTGGSEVFIRQKLQNAVVGRQTSPDSFWLSTLRVEIGPPRRGALPRRALHPSPQHGDPKAASYLLDMGELKLKTPLYL